MQDIIVIIIGLLVFGYIAWKIWKLITKKASPADKCGGCTGCALKEKTDCTVK